jgi:hypothetical protein
MKKGAELHGANLAHCSHSGAVQTGGHGKRAFQAFYLLNITSYSGLCTDRAMQPVINLRAHLPNEYSLNAFLLGRLITI